MDNNENEEMNQEIREEEEEDEPGPEEGAAMRLFAVINELINGNDDGIGDDEDIEDDEEEVDVPEDERVQFDMEASTSHQYLHAEDQSKLQIGQCWVAENDPVQLPVIRQNSVILPGQKLPIHTIIPSDRQAVKFAEDNRCYIALQTCFGHHRHGWFLNDDENRTDDEHGTIGTLLLLESISDDGQQIKAIAVGMQRCRFLEFQRGIAGVLLGKVEVVPETVMPSLVETICPNSSLKFGVTKKRRLTEAIGCIPSMAATSVSLTKNCKKLADWMRLWNSEEQINGSLQLGPERFSFWVAMNMPSRLRDKYEYLEQDCTDLRVVKLINAIKELTELVCSRCNQNISKIDKIIRMTIDSTSGHFVNNYGCVHEMLTLSEASNFRYEGRPTAEYSWFPGYKWQIMRCSSCGNHLGWEFTSSRFLPVKFYGLTRDGINAHAESNNERTAENQLADVVLRMIQNSPSIEEEL